MSAVRIIKERKRIALIAHDNKKADMVDWVQKNKEALLKHELFATGTTGKLIALELGVEVKRFLSGPLGGDQQIGSYIAEGMIDMMIFFWDPMEAQPHDSDVKALLRLGVAWNIPFACDRASADFIISSPFMDTVYRADVPDYTEYLTRPVVM